jgi:hypothetical protein
LGAPNSIKGHTEAVFQRQNGSHLLLVGQSAERNLTLLGIAAASLASQFPAGRVEFHLFDPSPDPSFFQMSAGDSANLVDSPAAASLGPHRTLLHNEHLGTQETFRPYAMPEDPDWLMPSHPLLRGLELERKMGNH